MSNQITTAMVDAGVAQLNRYLTGQIEPVSGLAVSLIYSAMLQASGGVSGEDGELIAGLRAYQERLNGAREVLNTPDTPMAPMPQTVGIAADRIVALLAERDGLKHDRDEWKGRATDRDAEAEKYARRAWAAEAALADALGLLRELDATDGYNAEQAGDFRTRLNALLAKHGKTEEAKTNG